MYNSQIIIDLLDKNHIPYSELMRHLGISEKANLKQQIFRNIGVDKLEKIADFLRVPIDTLFDRSSINSGVIVNGHDHTINTITVQQQNEMEAMKKLLEEKDKRIELLEEMLNMYKSK